VLAPSFPKLDKPCVVGNPEVIPLTFSGATPECTHGINTGMRHSHRIPASTVRDEAHAQLARPSARCG
jgi:hypothetical protein